MTTTDPGSDKAVQAWYALYRRAINEANGLTNYVEDRPELRSAEKRIARIEEEARAITSAPPAQPQSELPAESERDFLQWVLDTLIELNPSNYDHDDACQCSSAAVEVMLAARARLAAQPPERAAQQEAQEAEPAAWQERTQLEREKWSEWYERSSGWSLARPCEIESGGIKYQFRPLYASPPRAVEPMPALAEAAICRLADAKFPDWRIDIQQRFVVELIRAYEAARGIGKQGQG